MGLDVIYIVYASDWECSPIIGVYSDAETAMLVTRNLNDRHQAPLAGQGTTNYFAVAHAVDKVRPDLEGNLWWNINLHNYDASSDVLNVELELTPQYQVENLEDDYTSSFAHYTLQAPTDEEALAIAREHLKNLHESSIIE